MPTERYNKWKSHRCKYSQSVAFSFLSPNFGQRNVTRMCSLSCIEIKIFLWWKMEYLLPGYLLVCMTWLSWYPRNDYEHFIAPPDFIQNFSYTDRNNIFNHPLGGRFNKLWWVVSRNPTSLTHWPCPAFLSGVDRRPTVYPQPDWCSRRSRWDT